MSVIGSNVLAGASGSGAAAGYEITRSLRFNSADSAYLNRTPSSAGNRKTWTWSGWVKRSALHSGTANTYMQLFTAGTGSAARDVFFFDTDTDDTLALYSANGFSASVLLFRTNAVFRDASAWYHVVLSVDTTQGTAANRIKLYVNGIEQSFSTANYPSQNAEGFVNQNNVHYIGTHPPLGQYLNGYLADVHFIDGQALAASDFGEYDDNNVWQPKEFAGTYGFVAVSEATGALPIYNTTDTFGEVKGTGTRTDADAANLVLAVPMDGANNGTTFTDESATIKGSGSAKSITRNGDTKTVTTESKFYGSSGYFDGTGDYLSASNADFAFGTGDFTVEGWVRVSALAEQNFIATRGSTGSSTAWSLAINSSGNLYVYTNAFIATGTTPLKANTWAHVAASRSGTTLKLFVDGIQVAATTNNQDFTVEDLAIGHSVGGTQFPLTGHMQDVRLYKGVAKYTSDFTVSERTNSFHLDFSDNSSAAALGTDSSGNSNTWTVNNLSVASGAGNDSLIDSPTNYEADSGNNGGNYATLNPLDAATPSSLSNGNLDQNGGNNVRATIGGIGSGKWYWEFTKTSNRDTSGTNIGSVGIFPNTTAITALSTFALLRDDGLLQENGSSIGTYSTWTNGDVMGIAMNNDTAQYSIYKNGTLLFTRSYPSGITAANATPAIRNNTGQSGATNFGQRPFAYTPPTGYVSLCTQNLPDPTIADGSTAFEARTYNGVSGASSQTGYNFGPDFVWIKRRNSTSNHTLTDSVRGAGYILQTNNTNAEVDNTAYFTAFTSDGYSFGLDGGDTDAAGGSYVAWAWDAGTSTVSNTDGTITSTVRANASAGFSIVSYTGNGTAGATVAHGLNANVALYFIKNRSNAANWAVLGHALNDAFGGSNKFLLLNDSAAAGQAAQGPGDTSTIELYSDATNNTNGDDYIAYCFASVEGYSAFGSYTGNGSADGPYVYTGMRPKWLLIKRTDSSKAWQLMDTSRDPINPADTSLFPASNDAESGNNANYYIDILSNGFKIRTSHDSRNASSGTYIYAAFAEHPFSLNGGLAR